MNSQYHLRLYSVVRNSERSLFEVATLPFAGAVTRHIDMTSEVVFLRIETGYLPTSFGERSWTAQPWLFSLVQSYLATRLLRS